MMSVEGHSVNIVSGPKSYAGVYTGRRGPQGLREGLVSAANKQLCEVTNRKEAAPSPRGRRLGSHSGISGHHTTKE